MGNENAWAPDAVRDFRISIGMTQREMADALGVTERTYQRWEAEGPTLAASKALEHMREVRS